MLVTSFQLEGESSVNYRVHKLMLLSAPPAGTLQAAAAPHHLHFATDTASAAPESSAGPLAGPSGHHGEEQGENNDVFSPSTPVQPSNQVSQYVY